MKKYKLENCPWCESYEYLHIGQITGCHSYPCSTHTHYFVKCIRCYAQGPHAKDKKEAEEKWNEAMWKIPSYDELTQTILEKDIDLNDY